MDYQSPMLRLAANVRLFAGMPMTLISRVIGFADKVFIKNDDLFFNEGDTGESFYILVIGHVLVEQQKGGKWVQLAQLHPGDSFGEMALVDDRIRTARVRASGDCTAMYFPISRLKSDTEITSYLYRNIAKVLVARLKQSNNVVLQLNAKLAPELEAEAEAEAAAKAEAEAKAKAEADSAAPAAADKPEPDATEAKPAAPAAGTSAAPAMSVDDIPELRLRPGGYRTL